MRKLESEANLEVLSGLGQVFLEVDTSDAEGFLENWNKHGNPFYFSGLGIEGVATRAILITNEEGQKPQVFLKVETSDPKKFVFEWKELVDEQGYSFSGLASLGVEGKVVGVTIWRDCGKA